MAIEGSISRWAEIVVRTEKPMRHSMKLPSTKFFHWLCNKPIKKKKYTVSLHTLDMLPKQKQQNNINKITNQQKT